MAKVLQQSKLIVWNECMMVHKKSLEALDRTMKVCRTIKTNLVELLLTGDFCQTLPVIPRFTPMDELDTCLTLDRVKSVWVASQ